MSLVETTPVRVPEPPMSAMDKALEAMRMGKSRIRRRAIRSIAHSYDRGLLLAYDLDVPKHWLDPRYDRDPFITRAIIRRLRVAILRDRRFRWNRLRAPLSRETRLLGLLGGEMLKLGRNVREPEDI